MFLREIKSVVVTSFGGPTVLRVLLKKLPPLEKGQVLIKIKAVGVNPADTYGR